jgi:DNA repair photolyase
MEPRQSDLSIPGRGAASNPGNRFERAHYAPDEDPQANYDDESRLDTEPGGHLKAMNDTRGAGGVSRVSLTQYLSDHSRTIIAANNSPDVPFARSINPYRGCAHGCIYCYARPTHEYLGMSAGLDFESRILVKHQAAELLRAELAAKSWQPQMIALSGVTDCYQPIERQLRLTRRCLEVLLEFRNPVGIVTKNRLVVRDLDLLVQLAAFDCIQVFLSLTTLDQHLTQVLEPRTSVPRDRLRAVRELSAAGVPVGVLLAPIIPALNDHEIPALLTAAKEAGARSAAWAPLRLPFVVKDLFTDWLERHLPERKDKVLHRIRELRGGRLNDPKSCSRMRGEGVWAEHLGQTFHLHAARLGLNQDEFRLSTAHFRRPLPASAPKGQLPLFQEWAG